MHSPIVRPGYRLSLQSLTSPDLGSACALATEGIDTLVGMAVATAANIVTHFMVLSIKRAAA
jgi:hypothetical protein